MEEKAPNALDTIEENAIILVIKNKDKTFSPIMIDREHAEMLGNLIEYLSKNKALAICQERLFPEEFLEGKPIFQFYGS